MYIANLFYVVYGTTLVRTKNKMSKSKNQERKERKTKYPNFKGKIWVSIWISFKPAHLAHPQLITVDSFCPNTSLYISAKLPTYPSPKQTLTLTTHLGQNVGLGEG